MSHKQISVKVNVFVDEGIACVVSALNKIEGISTFSSCEGVAGKEYAHVYFDYPTARGWIKLARLASKLAHILAANDIYDSSISLEWTGDKTNPFISFEFAAELSEAIALVLNDHRSELVYGT